MHAVEAENDDARSGHQTGRAGPDVEEERRSERRSGWTDPRVITSVFQLAFSGCSILVSLAGVAIIIGGGLLGFYVLTQTKTVSSEMSTAQLAVEIGKVNSNVDRLGGDVKTALTALTTQQGKLDTHGRDIEQLQQTDKELKEMIERNERAQRDYNYNLNTSLTEIKTALAK